MTTFFRFLAIIFTLLWGFAAHAQFESVQIPGGLDFECDEEWSVGECEEELAHEIWFLTYYDQVQQWKEELFFNTNIFFHPYEETYAEDGSMVSHEGMDFLDEGSLIDVRYSGFKRFGWAFAIDVVCEKGWQYYGENCVPKLRLMDFAGEGKRPDILAKNRTETVEYYGVNARWLEANIRSCDGALNHLLSFPKSSAAEGFWHKDYIKFLKGKELNMPDEIIATMDGDSVLVRARGYADPSATNVSQLGESFILHKDRNGGPGYDWALEMKDIVEPCLKPSTAPAPWEKVLAAE